MARLPIIDGDYDDWGVILNQFLEVSHNQDGTLISSAVSAALPSPIPTGNLGSGTASISNFLRGDGTWAVPNSVIGATGPIGPTGTSGATGSTGPVGATGAGASGALLSSNNLSDVSSASTSLGHLGGAPLASPTFTGTPSAPTATAGTNTTQIATTAFATGAISALSGMYVPTAGGTVTGTLNQQIAGDNNPRVVLNDGKLLIGNPNAAPNFGTDVPGNKGVGSDFQVSMERTFDGARLLNLREPRYYLYDNNGNQFTLSLTPWSSGTLNTTLTLSCTLGSFSALANPGSITLSNVADGTGVISYTGVTGTGGVGTAGTLTGCAIVSGTLSQSTDSSARALIRGSDSFGAEIFDILNSGGLRINDQISFNSAGVGYASANDIVVGYTNWPARTGGGVIYGTDYIAGNSNVPYVYTYRTDSGGYHYYRIFADNAMVTWNAISGLYPSTPLGLGSNAYRWGTSYIGSVLGGTGSATSPVFGFANDTTGGTGLFSLGASTGGIGLTSSGAQVASFSPTGLLMGLAGTAAAPVIAVPGGTSGIYQPSISGSNSLGFTVGGVGFANLTHNVSTGGQLMYPASDNNLGLGTSSNRWSDVYSYLFIAESGLVTAPSHTFRADTTTGIYLVTSGELGITAGSTSVATATSSGMALTGTPTAPTATPGTNTTQIATTAFVGSAVSAATSSTLASGVASATSVGAAPDLRPTGWTSESAPRGLMASATVPAAGAVGATGTLRLTAVYLASGTVVNNLNVMIGSTGATAPTHFWMGLYDNNRNQLATTADQGTAAIAANTLYSLPVAITAAGSATSFTTTYSGLHYVGVLVIATTTLPLQVGPTSSIAGEYAIILPPILSGTSDTATGSAPAFPHQAAALSGSEMVYVGTS
jgi:hypothetical protein